MICMKERMVAEIKIFPDSVALARAAAEQVITLGNAAILTAGRFSIALSGGSTPRTMFGLLASEEFASRIDWSKVHLFWGDERCVPPDHPDSNYLMTRETLIDNISIPAENIHRMHGELPPEAGAAAYVDALKAFFGTADFPHFDLILLGMGDDGHTASLFPGTAAIHEEARWAIAHYVEKVNMWRITLTPPVLNAGKTVAFLVAGKDKAERLASVLRGPHQPDVLPSQIIAPTSGQLYWMIDTAAAERIG
jgi:6-phosphogluconolactonase